MKSIMNETRIVPIPMLGIGAVKLHFLAWVPRNGIILIETPSNL